MTPQPILELERRRVNQDMYADTLRAAIGALDSTESLVILIVCPLLKEVEDDESVIFVFPATAKQQALEAIVPWAEKFQSVHLLMPALTMQFGLIQISSADWEKLIVDPVSFGPDAVMIASKVKFWQQQ